MLPLWLLGWRVVVPPVGIGKGWSLLVGGLAGPKLAWHLPKKPNRLAWRGCWPMEWQVCCGKGSGGRWVAIKHFGQEVNKNFASLLIQICLFLAKQIGGIHAL